MTPGQRYANSRAVERGEIREAIATSEARASIDRMLGEDLIAAAREAVAAWHEYRNEQKPSTRPGEVRMFRAIGKLASLVGRP